MFPILLSCLVSLITIFILFFQVQNINPRKIPSWFFGKENKKTIKNKILINKPPLIPLVLIILATIAFAISYYPQKEAKGILPLNKSALIWIDPSLQAKLSRENSNFNPQREADKITDLGYKNFGLESFFKIQNGRPKIEYKVIELKSNNEVYQFLKEQNNQPISPFTQSILSDEVSKILNNNENFHDKKNTIIAFSDGYSESIQGIFSLKKFFDNGILFKYKAFDYNVKHQKEIVPTDLFSLWGEKTESKTSFTSFNSYKSIIPEEARPHLFITSYHVNSDNFEVLITKNNKKQLPLFIGCSNRFPSPIELDSFSNLRTLVSFFGNDFIEKNCEKEKNSIEHSFNKNIWKYRNSTVWIVQLNDQILSTMNDDLTFWIPEGFDPNFDTLVYTAGNNSTLQTNEENRAEKIAVQLDSGSFPLTLLLVPPPPGAELGVKFPDDNRTYKGIFKPFLNTSDGTTLAWKASSLPFFYLRTSTSTPNGELGRSRTWTHFWFEVANNIKDSNLSYTKINLDDISRLNDKLEEAEISINDKFTEFLNLDTLNFSETKNLSLGLYKLENKNRWILFNSLREGKNSIYLTPDDFNQTFSISTTTSKNQIQKNFGESIFPLIAAIFGTIILLFLWKKNKKNITYITLFLILSYNNKSLYAQSKLENFNLPFFSNNKISNQSVEQENIPFRIAWCGKEVPAQIEKNYSELRNIIMRRGTIVFPNKLKTNNCVPGEAEIWWTNDFRELNIKNLHNHIANGGIFILEGTKEIPPHLFELNDQSIGIEWESPKKRGMFYRSFYLLNSLDGCINDSSKTLILKKKINAQAPYGLVTSAHFLSNGEDCFKNNNDFKIRSFINIMYSFLTTDYKEDQIQLPEILNRIRNLGLEP